MFSTIPGTEQPKLSVIGTYALLSIPSCITRPSALPKVKSTTCSTTTNLVSSKKSSKRRGQMSKKGSNLSVQSSLRFKKRTKNLVNFLLILFQIPLNSTYFHAISLIILDTVYLFDYFALIITNKHSKLYIFCCFEKK